MTNKVTSLLSKEMGRTVSNLELLNLMRLQSSDAFQADIPEYDTSKVTRINHNTMSINKYEQHQNEFFSVLFDRIGRTIIDYAVMDNPLSVFRREGYDYGRDIQEIYIGLAKKENRDVTGDVSPFKYNPTETMVAYHTDKRDEVYARSIAEDWAKRAFISDNEFDKFIDGLFATLMTSLEIDDFEAVKLKLTQALVERDFSSVIAGKTAVKMPSTIIDNSKSDWALQLSKEIKKRSSKFTIASRTMFENAMGVPNSTPLGDQYLIVSSDAEVELQHMLASVFNDKRIDWSEHMIVVDEFPTVTDAGKDLDGKKPIAFLVSRDTVIVDEKHRRLESIFNPRALRFEYFLHYSVTYGISPFNNAHAFLAKQ